MPVQWHLVPCWRCVAGFLGYSRHSVDSEASSGCTSDKNTSLFLLSNTYFKVSTIRTLSILLKKLVSAQLAELTVQLIKSFLCICVSGTTLVNTQMHTHIPDSIRYVCVHLCVNQGGASHDCYTHRLVILHAQILLITKTYHSHLITHTRQFDISFITTVTIYYSFSLPLQAQNSSFPQILFSIVLLPFHPPD